MKALSVTIFLAMAVVAPAWAGNPLFEGWYADPEGTIIGDEYWIFPTYSAPYDQQLHFDAFSSKDLVTWTKHERIISNREISWLRRALWAPAIVQKDGKFYLFFGANDVHQGEIGGIGVAVADRPDGPYKDLLGKPLIGEIHNGAQPIDQFVFLDKDGQYYMIYGGWSHCNIAKLKVDFTGFIPFDDGVTFKEITPQGYVEGPFMFLRNGKYYFMWSEGGWGGPRYSVAYAIADSPMGPFQRIGKVLQQDPAVATGAGHHSVIHDAQADIWYAVYHRRPLGEKEANHRVTCMDRMYFDEQGLIKPIKITHEGVERRTLEPADTGLKMSISTTKPARTTESPVFCVAIENAGGTDVMLNLGMMLANGKALLPDAIRLILVDSSGGSRDLHYFDRRYGAVAGRADDYLVPLRVGSTYTLTLSMEEFCCPATQEFRMKLKPGEYRIHAELTSQEARCLNSDMEGVKFINIWKGSLRSDAIAFRISEE